MKISWMGMGFAILLMAGMADAAGSCVFPNNCTSGSRGLSYCVLLNNSGTCAVNYAVGGDPNCCMGQLDDVCAGGGFLACKAACASNLTAPYVAYWLNSTSTCVCTADGSCDTGLLTAQCGTMGANWVGLGWDSCGNGIGSQACCQPPVITGPTFSFIHSNSTEVEVGGYINVSAIMFPGSYPLDKWQIIMSAFNETAYGPELPGQNFTSYAYWTGNLQGYYLLQGFVNDSADQTDMAAGETIHVYPAGWSSTTTTTTTTTTTSTTTSTTTTTVPANYVLQVCHRFHDSTNSSVFLNATELATQLSPLPEQSRYFPANASKHVSYNVTSDYRYSSVAAAVGYDQLSLYTNALGASVGNYPTAICSDWGMTKPLSRVFAYTVNVTGGSLDLSQAYFQLYQCQLESACDTQYWPATGVTGIVYLSAGGYLSGSATIPDRYVAAWLTLPDGQGAQRLDVRDADALAAARNNRLDYSYAVAPPGNLTVCVDFGYYDSYQAWNAVANHYTITSPSGNPPPVDGTGDHVCWQVGGYATIYNVLARTPNSTFVDTYGTVDFTPSQTSRRFELQLASPPSTTTTASTSSTTWTGPPTTSTSTSTTQPGPSQYVRIGGFVKAYDTSQMMPNVVVRGGGDCDGSDTTSRGDGTWYVDDIRVGDSCTFRAGPVGEYKSQTLSFTVVSQDLGKNFYLRKDVPNHNGILDIQVQTPYFNGYQPVANAQVEISCPGDNTQSKPTDSNGGVQFYSLIETCAYSVHVTAGSNYLPLTTSLTPSPDRQTVTLYGAHPTSGRITGKVENIGCDGAHTPAPTQTCLFDSQGGSMQCQHTDSSGNFVYDVVAGTGYTVKSTDGDCKGEVTVNFPDGEGITREANIQCDVCGGNNEQTGDDLSLFLTGLVPLVEIIIFFFAIMVLTVIVANMSQQMPGGGF